MKYLKTVSILFILFCSCNFRIYTNGTFDHKTKGLTSKWRTANDSCIILFSGDKLPEGAVAVNNTEIRSPFVWLTVQLPSEIMVNELKTQAQKVNANMVWIDSAYAKKFTRLHTEARMYSLKGAALATYKAQIAVPMQAKANYCIIHLKNLANIGKDHIRLLFNDSIVLELSDTGKQNRSVKRQNRIKLANVRTYTLELNHGGELVAEYITPKGKVDKYYGNADMILAKGKEYDLYLQELESSSFFNSVSSPCLRFVKYEKHANFKPF
jgi:hypothetical protein